MSASEDAKRKSVRRGPSDAGRELATLTGGDRDRWWFWLDELEDSIRAARRFAPDHPAGALQNYVRTETREPHPWAAGETGVIYRWQEPSPTASPT